MGGREWLRHDDSETDIHALRSELQAKVRHFCIIAPTAFVKSRQDLCCFYRGVCGSAGVRGKGGHASTRRQLHLCVHACGDTMALLEDKLLSFSLLTHGEDEDKRHEHYEEEEGRKYDEQEEAALAAGCPDDGELGGGSSYRQWEAAGMTKEDYKQMVKEAADAERRAADPLAERTGGRRTGPKGVIADKKWHDYQQMKKRARDSAAARDALRRAAAGADGTLVDGNPESVSLAATWATSGPKFDSKVEQKREEDRGKAETDELDFDDGEEDFLAAYKAKRLQELRGASSSAAPASTYSSASLSSVSSRAAASASAAAEALLPRYDDEDEGWPLEVTSQRQFVSTLDALDKRSYAVVLMWERFIPAAAHLKSRVWPALASLHPHVAFLSAVSGLLSESIDVIGLPAIVIYRGGQTVEALVRVQDLIGDERPTVEDGTELLRAHGVRPLSQTQAPLAGGRK